MSDTKEPLDIAVIEARLAAATPGPWKEYKWEIHPVLDYGGSGNDCHAICTEFYGPQAMQNRVLVANAPADIAALVARVRELEAENKARFTVGAKETKERVLSAIDMAGLMEAKFGTKDRARVIAEIKLLVQSIEVEVE
jgi:hypothetical protein